LRLSPYFSFPAAAYDCKKEMNPYLLRIEISIALFVTGSMIFEMQNAKCDVVKTILRSIRIIMIG
jgi:hypothetical protein